MSSFDMGGFDLNKIVEKAKDLQEQFSKNKEEMSKKRFVGKSGGGLVSVTIDGDSKIVSLEISDDIFKSQDKEVLEDLIVAASSDAYNKRSKEIKNDLSNLSNIDLSNIKF